MKINSCLLVLLLFLLPADAFARGGTETVEKLDAISDSAYQMVKNQRYSDAQRLLNYFSDEFNGINETSMPLTLDEIRIVAVSTDEAMEAAASPIMDYEERVEKLTKFRFVIDSLAVSDDPLWTEMEERVLNALEKAKEAALEGESEQYYTSFNSFLSLYEMIYPSIRIDRPSEYVQKLEAKVDYLERYSPIVPAGEEEKVEFEALEAMLRNVFDGVEEDEADPSLWWVIISTGGIIISTLSYVGWRKYKGGREAAERQKSEQKS